MEADLTQEQITVNIEGRWYRFPLISLVTMESIKQMFSLYCPDTECDQFSKLNLRIACRSGVLQLALVAAKDLYRNIVSIADHDAQSYHGKHI
jgi:hypothetical protein